MLDFAWLIGLVLYLTIFVTITIWFFRYHCDKRSNHKHREPEFTNQTGQGLTVIQGSDPQTISSTGTESAVDKKREVFR